MAEVESWGGDDVGSHVVSAFVIGVEPRIAVPGAIAICTQSIGSLSEPILSPLSLF